MRRAPVFTATFMEHQRRAACLNQEKREFLRCKLHSLRLRRKMAEEERPRCTPSPSSTRASDEERLRSSRQTRSMSCSRNGTCLTALPHCSQAGDIPQMPSHCRLLPRGSVAASIAQARWRERSTSVSPCTLPRSRCFSSRITPKRSTSRSRSRSRSRFWQWLDEYERQVQIDFIQGADDWIDVSDSDASLDPEDAYSI